MPNRICEIARRNKRTVVLAEDVLEALMKWRVNKIRRDVLDIVAKNNEYTMEDPELCAYIAWRGRLNLPLPVSASSNFPPEESETDE